MPVSIWPGWLCRWCWQPDNGRRGLVITMTVVVAGKCLWGRCCRRTVRRRGRRSSCILAGRGRRFRIGLVAIVVERLAAAQRREQAALEAANRQLAARAATVEQLTESRERNRLARRICTTRWPTCLTGLSVQLQACGQVDGERDPRRRKYNSRRRKRLCATASGEARRRHFLFSRCAGNAPGGPGAERSAAPTLPWLCGAIRHCVRLPD